MILPDSSTLLIHHDDGHGRLVVKQWTLQTSRGEVLADLESLRALILSGEVHALDKVRASTYTAWLDARDIPALRHAFEEVGRTPAAVALPRRIETSPDGLKILTPEVSADVSSESRSGGRRFESHWRTLPTVR